MNRTYLTVAALLFTTIFTMSCSAESLVSPTVDFLPLNSQSALGDVASPHQVFRPEIRSTGGQYQLIWTISPGYYLYRDKLLVESSDDKSIKKIALTFESGEQIDDEVFGLQTIFRQFTVIGLPADLRPADGQPLSLTVTFQGCQEGRLCYPPVTIELVDLTLPTTHNQTTL